MHLILFELQECFELVHGVGEHDSVASQNDIVVPLHQGGGCRLHILHKLSVFVHCHVHAVSSRRCTNALAVVQQHFVLLHLDMQNC